MEGELKSSRTKFCHFISGKKWKFLLCYFESTSSLLGKTFRIAWILYEFYNILWQIQGRCFTVVRMKRGGRGLSSPPPLSSRAVKRVRIWSMSAKQKKEFCGVLGVWAEGREILLEFVWAPTSINLLPFPSLTCAKKILRFFFPCVGFCEWGRKVQLFFPQETREFEKLLLFASCFPT